MKQGFVTAVILAAGLAGCGATPVEHRNEKEAPLPPGQGMFGDTMTWQWVRKDQMPSSNAAPATAAEQDDFKKWRESAGASERSEFEDWRAWQEWKKKNPK
jgi:hypothetical protein